MNWYKKAVIDEKMKEELSKLHPSLLKNKYFLYGVDSESFPEVEEEMKKLNGGGWEVETHKPRDMSGFWDNMINQYETASSKKPIAKTAKLDGVYNIFLIASNTPERVLKDTKGNIIEIKADSSEQARKFALDKYPKLVEWNNEYAGRSIVARLNKEKMQEIEKYREQQAVSKEEKIQNAWWNK